MNDNQPRMNSQHQDTLRQKIEAMSDQDVTQRYGQELRKLRALNQYGRHSERFQGYPDTRATNVCRRELQRRGLPVPPVNPPDAPEGGHENA